MEAKFDQIAKNHSSSIYNIEVQLEQLANAMATRAQENLPSTIESNLKKLKAITLWSGKKLKSQYEAPKEIKGKEDN